MLKQPITYSILVALGYSYHPCDYYCPPSPAHGGMYRIGVKEDKDGNLKHFIHLTDPNSTYIRDVETLEQLNNVHKGFCDEPLFNINDY